MGQIKETSKICTVGVPQGTGLGNTDLYSLMQSLDVMKIEMCEIQLKLTSWLCKSLGTLSFVWILKPVVTKC